MAALLARSRERAVQRGEVRAPCSMRKHPEIFLRSFVMRRS